IRMLLTKVNYRFLSLFIGNFDSARSEFSDCADRGNLGCSSALNRVHTFLCGSQNPGNLTAPSPRDTMLAFCSRAGTLSVLLSATTFQLPKALMPTTCFVPIDLGASSGRHLAALFDGQRLSLEEIYRFENGPVHAGGRMHWDLLGLWQHIQNGLRAV